MEYGLCTLLVFGVVSECSFCGCMCADEVQLPPVYTPICAHSHMCMCASPPGCAAWQTKYFGVEPAKLLGDICNMIQDYIHSAVDALDEPLYTKLHPGHPDLTMDRVKTVALYRLCATVDHKLFCSPTICVLR